jgi:TrwC relaxase
MLVAFSAHWTSKRKLRACERCGRPVMSMARLSAGAGYRYLLRHTAAGDAARPQATSLVDYYAATGYPPGRWLGSGLSGLNDGAGIISGSVVTERALSALYAGLDPVSGQPLGRPFRTYAVDGRGVTACGGGLRFDVHGAQVGERALGHG